VRDIAYSVAANAKFTKESSDSPAAEPKTSEEKPPEKAPETSPAEKPAEPKPAETKTE
jgi:hypothetical protein